MNCMKCGRELSGDGVFCPDCLAEMEKYPVKPGTVVQIPSRPAVSPARKPVKRTLSPEEQVRALNRRIRRLWGALIFSGLVTLAAIGLAIYGLQDEELHFLPGQNYSSAQTTEPNAPR